MKSFRVESERRLFNISIAIDGTKAASHGVESCSEASGMIREAGADWDWYWDCSWAALSGVFNGKGN